VSAAPRRVDPDKARARLEAALDSHEQAFESFFLARLLGLEFTYLPEDAPAAEKHTCVVTFPVDEMVMNPQGSVHGGIMASVMDISMGHLIKKTADTGATIEMKIQFMRPLTGTTARAEGRFTKRGRSISFMESRVVDGDGKLAGLATATWKMP
jgi:uncharacterized protein (TIGR00369 family)